jgi:hypothetical protein
MKAINQNVTVQVLFSAGATTYVVQKCTPSCANDGDNVVLPQGITVTASVTPQFLPRGTAGATATVTLSNGASTAQVQILPVGRIKVL